MDSESSNRWTVDICDPVYKVITITVHNALRMKKVRQAIKRFLVSLRREDDMMLLAVDGMMRYSAMH